MKMFVVSPLSLLVNNRYVLTSFPSFEIDRFLTTGCCLVIQEELRRRAALMIAANTFCVLPDKSAFENNAIVIEGFPRKCHSPVK